MWVGKPSVDVWPVRFLLRYFERQRIAREKAGIPVPRTGPRELAFKKKYVCRPVPPFLNYKWIPKGTPTLAVGLVKPELLLPEDEEAERQKLRFLRASYSTYRTLIMCFGVMQSFKIIADVDIEWPTMFFQIANFFAMFTFTFDFFKPECSVKAAYWKSWLGMTLMPYLVMAPIILSYEVSRLLLFDDIGDPRYKAIILKNQLARTLCMVCIVFMPMHFIQVTKPMDCVAPDSGIGFYTMRSAPDVGCDDSIVS